MLAQGNLKQIIEAALLAAGGPLSLDRLMDLFPEEDRPERKVMRETLDELQADYDGRGIELREVGSGYRIQVRAEYAPFISRLWDERPPRYSRALLETLALIAYRQPITRGEIEDIRGVAVSTNIIKTLTEREWVRVVGHRDVPGKPALFATTREFLDYFSLKGLGDLPSLPEIRDLDSINRELELIDPQAKDNDASSAESADEDSNEAIGSDEASLPDVTEETDELKPTSADDDEVTSAPIIDEADSETETQAVDSEVGESPETEIPQDNPNDDITTEDENRG